jgi:hypothetical protein
LLNRSSAWRKVACSRRSFPTRIVDRARW